MVLGLISNTIALGTTGNLFGTISNTAFNHERFNRLSVFFFSLGTISSLIAGDLLCAISESLGSGGLLWLAWSMGLMSLIMMIIFSPRFKRLAAEAFIPDPVKHKPNSVFFTWKILAP